MFRTLLISSLLWSCYPVVAQVTLDGTLGKSGALPGPNYQIGADVGQQHGGNLFHSFQDFNLQSHESATFSGPDNVQNVISRVTGGNPSSIDGTLRSTIPNADLYFLNPYGIMFGPNAKLDVQGGFHASTADYLRLQDGGRFEARTPGNSLLTVAPVAAFGFLTDTPATITTQNSILTVPPFKPLSLIGGNLHLQGSLPIQFDDLNIYAKFATSLLKTTGGTLNLAAIGSVGEILVNNPDLTLTGRGGEIRLDRTLVDTSGLGSGNLKIRGGWLFMSDSTLQANTLGDFNGGLMDLQLTDSLHATSTPYYFFGLVSKALQGRGQAGSIAIKVPELTLDRVLLGTNSFTEGHAGNLDLEVSRLNLLTGAGLSAAAMGRGYSGENGQVTIKATESVSIAGQSMGNYLVNGVILTNYPSHIENPSYPSENEKSTGGDINLTTQRLDLAGGLIDTAGFGRNKGGNLFIQAANANLTEGGFIVSDTFGMGAAGNLRLTVTDTLSLSGRRPGDFIVPVVGTRLENYPSLISSDTFVWGQGGEINVTASRLDLAGGLISSASLGQGQGGNITLQTDNVNVTGGGLISSSTLGTGAAGNIQLTVTDTLSLSGRRLGSVTMPGGVVRMENYSSLIDSTALGQGQGGNINVIAHRLNLTTGGISAATQGPGNAGHITIQADNVNFTQGGYINTVTNATGAAGQIRLTVTDTLSMSGHMDEPFVIAGTGERFENFPSSISSETTSQGPGGHIFLQANSLDLDKGAAIAALSRGGMGVAGEIHLQTHHLSLQHGSAINTSATQAGGGNIELAGLSELLYLENAEITTSVAGGTGSGGNITIGEPQFTILNKGLIRAQADAGNGGNIRIVAEQFIATPDSLVSASSRLGIDGHVVISSPDPNISGKLFLVSTKALDVSSQLKRPCGSAKTLEEIMNPRFKFYVYPIAGSRQSFEDWGPSPLPSRSARAVANGKTETVHGKPTEAGMDRAGYQLGRLMAECSKAESIGRLE